MTTKTENHYQHLEPRPGSNYRTLFLKGRRIRAAVVDGVINGPDPRSAEEFAREYQVPLEALLEALDYVAENGSRDWNRDHQTRSFWGWDSRPNSCAEPMALNKKQRQTPRSRPNTG